MKTIISLVGTVGKQDLAQRIEGHKCDEAPNKESPEMRVVSNPQGTTLGINTVREDEDDNCIYTVSIKINYCPFCGAKLA